MGWGWGGVGGGRVERGAGMDAEARERTGLGGGRMGWIQIDTSSREACLWTEGGTSFSATP